MIWLFLGALLLGLGCSQSNPFPLAPVKGTVKFTDGTVPQGEIATVDFFPDGIPPEGAMYARKATGTINADGSFELSTDGDGGAVKGAAVGKHKVVLSVYKKYLGPPNVHEKYTAEETTPLVAEVTLAGPNQFTFDQVEKP